MNYLFGLIISWVLGYLAIHWLINRKYTLNPYLHFFLAGGLGLGLSAQTVFYPYLLFNIFCPLAPLTIQLALFIGLGYITYKRKQPVLTLSQWQTPDAWGFLVILLLAIPVYLQAKLYPNGGWDAWSCWNLKAKFIYLGAEDWKKMLAPDLWRSNTHYPLLLPLINTWHWSLVGATPSYVPMTNAVIFTLSTAGVLFFGLRVLTDRWAIPLALTAAMISLHFYIMLGISQYSDLLFGYYLCSAGVCLLLAQKENRPGWLILTGIFLGLLSFTKVEGTAAAVIFASLILWRSGKAILPSLLITALPTIIFTLFISPKNEAFVNGLVSMDKPSTFQRFQAIMAFSAMEFISQKWNGIWILLLAGIMMFWKKALGKSLRIFALFFAIYFCILFAYYQINTFFEIMWWLTNTLNRILFSLLPAMLLWLGMAIL